MKRRRPMMNTHPAIAPTTRLNDLVQRTFFPRPEPQQGHDPVGGKRGKGKGKDRGDGGGTVEAAQPIIPLGEYLFGTVLQVCWWDAQAFALDWQDPDDQDGVDRMPTLSVGYLTRQTEHDLSITAIINTDCYGHGLTIPNGCIHSVTVLREPQ